MVTNFWRGSCRKGVGASTLVAHVAVSSLKSSMSMYVWTAETCQGKSLIWLCWDRKWPGYLMIRKQVITGTGMERRHGRGHPWLFTTMDTASATPLFRCCMA